MKKLSLLLILSLLATPCWAQMGGGIYNGGSGGGGGSSGGVSVTAASPNIVINPSPGTGTFTVGATNPINAQGTAASYTILSSDMGKTVTHNKSTAVAVTLPQAGTAGFESGKGYCEVNIGAGTVTITPTVSTINGNSTQTLTTGQGACFTSDGTNYIAQSGVGVAVPVSVANGGTGITSGTSGGIPAFTASGTMASSGALTANLPVIGGGAGVAPTVGTRTGNTTKFATSTGTLTNGDCVSIDGSGNLVDAGGACTTGGGGGTVASSTIGQVAVYTGATTVTGASAMTYTGGALTLGTANTTAGSVVLEGGTSGSVTVGVPAAAGSTTFTLPSSNGTNGQVLETNGSGVTSWATLSGSGSASVISPASIYTADTAGNLFPYIYVGAGGNASPADSGWGVVASLGSDVVLQMRFQMPSVLPSGTFKLVSYCTANASSGVAKYTISDADVAAGSNPSSASLTSETQTSITWSAVDNYVVTKTTLSSTPLVDDVSVVAITFNHTGWTLAQVMNCRWVELWE